MNTTRELIIDIQKGCPIILMDDEYRENEGDLIMAAQKLTPDHINFMITHGRGLFCLPLAVSYAHRLNLRPMVAKNRSRMGTNFTCSIGAAHGITTGISTQDRYRTVQAVVADHASPDDIVSPGHVFPLISQSGGVLTRAGHTEAATDLTRLAGFKPIATLIEILNDDGTMARRPELMQFAQQYRLKIGTIADLIDYRRTYRV